MDMMQIRRNMIGVIAQMAQGGFPAGVKAFAKGTVTISTARTDIDVTTNLGFIPDYAGIKIKLKDWNKIPYGCCVCCDCALMDFANIPNITADEYDYVYIYKHGTSGNLLKGQYQNTVATLATTTTFKFRRGASDWQPTDTDGNPIEYEWFVMKFDN